MCFIWEALFDVEGVIDYSFTLNGTAKCWVEMKKLLNDVALEWCNVCREA